MKLYKRLPYTVIVDGKRYKLRPYFDRVLYAMDVMRGTGTARQKLDAACYLLIKNRRIHDKPKVLSAALDVLLGPGGSDSKKHFDFEQDAEYIFASFLQAYGIDLFERLDLDGQKPLHWCEFMALFKALPEDTRMSQIISIRAQEIPKPTKHNAEMRQRIMRQKAAFALEITEEERKGGYQRGLQKLWDCLIRLSEE